MIGLNVIALSSRNKGSVVSLCLARAFLSLAVVVCLFLQGCGASYTTSSVTIGALSVSTTSLPSGVVGTAYSATLAGSGGTLPYTWTLTSGSLPAGLSLSTSGVISGTPTAAVTGTSLTFKVTDSSQPAQNQSATFSLTIAATAAPLTITTSFLPNGQVGTAYSTNLGASGGIQPYTWTLTSGSLPAGLSLSASGLISGTPTTVASATSLTFKVTDSSQPAQSQSVTLSLTIATATLTITTGSLPNGQVGTAYSTSLAATGGTPSYTWTLTSGTLPAGLTLSSSGVISGTPTASANATPLVFKVTDSGQPAQSQSVTLSLTIATATLTITTGSLPNGQVGTAYSTSLAATGGTPSYTWTLTSGTLPAGLTLSSSGVISGTPTASANATPLVFKVTDSGQPAQSQSVTLSLTVATATLTITTGSLPNGQVGTAYSTSLAATGGTPSYTWTLTSGTLPAGLTLSSSGVISGTPTAAVTGTSLTFKVTDSSQPAQNQSATFSLTIAATAAPLTITTSFLPNGQVGTAYSTNLGASGGIQPYTWTLTSGSLPAGLSLSASGLISGTPTTVASATSLTFKVTDSSQPAQSQSVTLSLTIATATLTITTGSLPNGQVGTAYSTSLAATGGTPSYTWTLTSGTLPAGLTLSSSGVISGTPTASANATPLVFKVTDSGQPAQSQSVTLSLTIATATLTITTGSLPNGQVGTAYSTSLAATGGTPSYTWTLTSGTLPAGLTLSSSGVISGTPTAAVTGTSLTFKVTDSSQPAQSQSVMVSLTITSTSAVSVSISPLRAGLTITQTLSLTGTASDGGAVNWSVTGSSCSATACGTFSSPSTVSGSPVTYTAPGTAGEYTITATSVNNSAGNSSITVGVTDLAGVLTYHNDLARDGANTQEYALNPTTVTTTTFGKLFSCTVDEAIYAQPLWVPNLIIGGVKRNVIFVATQNDSLYAFDADSNSTPCSPLWHANLLDAAHGGISGETSVPSSGSDHLVGYGNGDIAPEVGVTGTPVIDPATDTLYVVSKSVIASGPTFFQRLHGIDLLTGKEKYSGPVNIAATYPGSGDGGTVTTFIPQEENQRCGLALVNGVVYIAWASHEDDAPYYGWIIGYTAGSPTQSTLAQAYVFNDDPNKGLGGIWMSGGAPAADSAGNLYVITANGVFDATNKSTPNNDYGDSFLELSSSLTVQQYFTPSDQASDAMNDQDFGAGGAAVLADLPANGSNPTHLVVGGGKDGALYVLNRDPSKMGGSGDSNAWQIVQMASGIFSTGAFWNDNFYLATYQGKLVQLILNAATARFGATPSSSSSQYFGLTGASPSVTSMPDNSNGIVWALDITNYCTPESPGCGPTILHAYNAATLNTEYWNSTQGTGNTGGNAVKFTVPTVANGKVYVGTRGNNAGGADNSTSIPGQLDVYGLLP